MTSTFKVRHVALLLRPGSAEQAIVQRRAPSAVKVHGEEHREHRMAARVSKLCSAGLWLDSRERPKRSRLCVEEFEHVHEKTLH